ncbi:MAG: NUDIX hydrolase [Candidatus Nealsonbacteria bacterium]|nr:NUDIX hydrolase [Candidatus Nealsonbacteria bacterium]
MDVLARSYKEAGCQDIPLIRLSDEEYARGLQCFVPACADIAIVDFDRKLIYLARRKIKPMAGLWWIGGKMMPQETKEEAAVRNFKRETTLELPQSRFRLVAVFDYRWNDRAQTPQTIGCHMLAYTFIVNLSADELARVRLDENEYEGGLKDFTEKQLLKENVFSPIFDLYCRVFSAFSADHKISSSK